MYFSTAEAPTRGVRYRSCHARHIAIPHRNAGPQGGLRHRTAARSPASVLPRITNGAALRGRSLSRLSNARVSAPRLCTGRHPATGSPVPHLLPAGLSTISCYALAVFGFSSSFTLNSRCPTFKTTTTSSDIHCAHQTAPASERLNSAPFTPSQDILRRDPIPPS